MSGSGNGFKVPALPGVNLKRKYPGVSVEEDGIESGERDSPKRSRPTPTTSSPKFQFAKPALPPARSKPLAPSIPLHLSSASGSKAKIGLAEPIPPSITDIRNADPINGDRAGNGSEDDEEVSGAGDDTFEADDGDEEGGRFFGGGINSTQEQILDMFASAPDDPENLSQALTAPQLRKEITKFERVVQKNYEMRAKYPEEPERYIDSESDLDSAFQFLLPLSSNPTLYYPIILQSDTLLPSLMNLLTHENTDIALNVVGVLGELTDDDVGEEDIEAEEGMELTEDEEVEKADKERRVRLIMGNLIDALLSNNILDLLVANLIRLNETEETDQDGVFKILTVFENLLSFLPPVALQISESTEFMPWLVKRIQAKEYDSNKQYASEILAILLQDERDVRLKFVELNGVDGLLVALSQYIKKDPDGAEELEFMENLFNALCSALTEPEVKQLFLQSEGVELMVYMMREKLLARTRAIKVLDFALQTNDGVVNCLRFVDALGLKTLFAAFMGKGQSRKSKSNPGSSTTTSEDDEHVLSILSSLFTNLSSETIQRTRLIAKFVESEYEKVERLLELREVASERCRVVDRDVDVERELMRQNSEEITEEEEDEWYLRRLNGGLSMLQSADYCLAWVVMEDDGAMKHAKMMLARRGGSFDQVVRVLREYREAISIDPDPEETDEDGERGLGASGNGDEGGMSQAEILKNLIAFVEAL